MYECLIPAGGQLGIPAGISIRQKVEDSAPVILLQDSFTDPNDTVIASHTPEIGGPWIPEGFMGGSPVITDNRMKNNGLNAAAGLFDVGVPNQKITFKRGAAGGTYFDGVQGAWMLIARRVDASNYLRLTLYDNGSAAGWKLQKVVSGTASDVGVGPSPGAAINPADTFVLAIHGTTAKLTQNGTQVFRLTNLPADLLGTVIGCVLQNVANAWLDDLQVEEASAADVAT